jgi:hypothetical protein
LALELIDMENINDLEYFGFKKALENDVCIIYETLKGNKTHKVINFEKDANLYRFSNDCSKGDFTKDSPTFTDTELIYKLIDDKFDDDCNHFNVDGLEVIVEMIKKLNYHDTQYLLSRI